ncbi:family 16 glycosylhydrolase [Pseudoalteromonas fuliginea]|uniref:family 16 glycosylhydrolase n=1 Tax=Pseudoalteromonas fuliginea TaxID=1872678 RepID=UPI003179D410
MKPINLVTFPLSALSLLILSSASQAADIQPPIAKPGETWILQAKRSDEFDVKDATKWNFQTENYGVWSWKNQNATVSNGKLKLTTKRESHQRTFWDGCNQQQIANYPLYYTSGVAKSRATGNYGYYEARIKGASTFPGVSPAFWMYSTIDRSLTQEGDVQYSEIDVVELTQKRAVRESDHDLHNIVVKNGKPTWMRPGSFPQTNHNGYHLPFDPRNDFHTYGVNVTKDKITWYVDGEVVGEKDNLYWHRQMNLTLSQGLRAPHTQWKCNQFYPSDNKSAAGFPTSMEVDYVRTWVKVGNNNSDPSEGQSCPNTFVAVNNVQVSAPKQTLRNGQSTTLSSTVLPNCATNKKVIYSSSNKNVATVNSAGVVKAKNKGTATITAKTKNKGKTDKLIITVN